MHDQFLIRDIDRLGTEAILRICLQVGLLNSFREVHLGHWRVTTRTGEAVMGEQSYVRFYAKGLLHAALHYAHDEVKREIEAIKP